MSPLKKKCAVCDDNYDEEERKPLLLPCGHSFCVRCLQQVSNSDQKFCPMCRGDWHSTSVEDLPLCFQLLPEEDNNLVEERVKCSKHDTDITFWCHTCRTIICTKCLTDLHSSCNFIIIEEGVEYLQSCIQQIANDASLTIEKNLDIAQTNTTKIHTKLFMLKTVQKKLKKMMDTFMTYRHELSLSDVELTAKKAILNRLQPRREIINEEKESSLSSEDSADHSLNDISLQAYSLESHSDSSIQSLLKTWQELNAIKIFDVSPAKPSKSHLYQVLDTYQSMGRSENQPDFLSQLSLRLLAHQGFAPNGDWLVNSNTSARVAEVSLAGCAVRPKSITVTVSSTWLNPDLTVLLPAIARTKCDVSLQFLDSFYAPSGDSIVRNRRRLDQLLLPNHRCNLREFWGHLDVRGVNRLPQHSIEVLGLAVLNSNDHLTLQQVAHWPVCGVGFESLEEINLSLPLGDEVEDERDSEELATELLNITVRLHFPGARDTDVGRLMRATTTLITSKRYRSLHLPQSKLTVKGTALLATCLRSLEFPANVVLESASLTGAEKLAVEKIFRDCNVQLTWDALKNLKTSALYSNDSTISELREG